MWGINMAKVLVTESYLSAIADAIRDRLGTAVTYTPAEMAAAIESIPTGGVDRLPERIANTLSGAWIDSTTTYVGKYAFAGCTLLTSVEFSAATNIDNYSFDSCTGIVSAIANSSTRVGTYAFRGCTHLESISFNSATAVGTYAFDECTALSSISLPLAKTFGPYSFHNCDSLVSVSLPSATSLNYTCLFDDCANLVEVDCNGGGRARLGQSTFRNCTKLKRVNAQFTGTYSYSFQGCTSLNGDGLDLSRCTNIAASSFQNCSSLTDLYLTYNGTTALANTTAFSGTPIAALTGTIHVPASRLETYKKATRWSTYASIMVGDL